MKNVVQSAAQREKSVLGCWMLTLLFQVGFTAAGLLIRQLLKNAGFHFVPSTVG